MNEGFHRIHFKGAIFLGAPHSPVDWATLGSKRMVWEAAGFGVSRGFGG